MKKMRILLFVIPLVFAACDHRDEFHLSDKEKAVVLSLRAEALYNPDDPSLTAADTLRALATLDSALVFDPGNLMYHYQKAQYLQAARREEDLAPVLHRILSLTGEDYSGTLSLGMCFDRMGRADSARYYYDRALDLFRGQLAADTLTAPYIDTLCLARLEYLATGDREAAERKMKSVDTLKMTPEDFKSYRDIVGEFDREMAELFPHGRAITR